MNVGLRSEDRRASGGKELEFAKVQKGAVMQRQCHSVANHKKAHKPAGTFLRDIHRAYKISLKVSLVYLRQPFKYLLGLLGMVLKERILEFEHRIMIA